MMADTPAALRDANSHVHVLASWVLLVPLYVPLSCVCLCLPLQRKFSKLLTTWLLEVQISLGFFMSNPVSLSLRLTVHMST